jgi:hypothetical protein
MNPPAVIRMNAWSYSQRPPLATPRKYVCGYRSVKHKISAPLEQKKSIAKFRPLIHVSDHETNKNKVLDNTGTA